MKALTGGLLFLLVGAAAPVAQQRDRSLEPITQTLAQPRLWVPSVGPADGARPRWLGVFTFVPPDRPGEILRVSVPIGELVSRAFKGAAAANRRRQDAAARRRVEAALEWFTAQQPPPRY